MNSTENDNLKYSGNNENTILQKESENKNTSKGLTDHLKEVGITGATLTKNAVFVPLKLANKALDTTGQITSNILDTTGNITSSLLDTAGKTTEILGNTTTNVTENLGQVVTSATSMAANTIGTFDIVSNRIKNSTEEMAKRRAEIEKTKTAKQIGKTAKEIEQIEKDTDLDLQRIDNDFEKQKIEMEKEQELLLERINTNYGLIKLDQQENNNKISTSYYYGFQTEGPPYKTGINKTKIYYSSDKVWYYSYIPMSFVTNKGTFIELKLPDKKLDENIYRDQEIHAIDKQSRKKVTIDFEIMYERGYLWSSQKLVPVIKYDDDDAEIDENISKEPGKLYFKKIWFFKKKETSGGNKTGNKRKTKHMKRKTKKSKKIRKNKRKSMKKRKQRYTRT